MLRLDDIKRQIGARVLFESLSWVIPGRARLGLVGPNGAGKTTLLRIVCGREVPDAGCVQGPTSLVVGYLPQEVETVAGASVLEVVLSGAESVARLEGRLGELERELAELDPDDARAGELTRRYGDLRSRFEALGGDRIEARARAILCGLGVTEASHDRPPATLSGGWRMRVVLARLLLGAPDLLLLDEPTNHLDLEALDWLERFLADFDGAFVVVSHDRYFLNRVVEGVVELERGRLSTYTGSYDDYVAASEQARLGQDKAAREQARERARVERFIERFRYKASKARQVQSRVRALEKVERIESSTDAKTIRFRFPEAPRSGDVVARLDRVSKHFGPTRVYDGLSLVLRRGERVALVGPNGAGKSTLLKLLAGAIEPDGGAIELGQGVLRHYYAQHQLDALDPRRTVLEELEAAAPPDERPRLRSLAGCFLFVGEDVDKRVEVLSGGEKARLALARMLLEPANLLLLDEPTNHLDLRSREVLEEALEPYTGTLVFISHDRYFINRVANRVAEVGGGGLELYDGGFDEWTAWREARQTAEPQPAEARAGEPNVRREEKRREAEERNRLYRERKAVEERLRPIEDEVERLERRVAELQLAQADPQVYSDPERARDVARERTELEARLGRLYEAWEAAAEGS
jgi:ATP-binding cassette subfamily F protein 3